MRNCADANVSRMVPDASAARSVVTVTNPPFSSAGGQARCPVAATTPDPHRDARPVADGNDGVDGL
jgi:hypothetical protein